MRRWLLMKHGGWLQIYRSFGLGSSYADVMRFDCLLQYSEYEAGDRSFPDVPSRLLEDIYQVGTCTSSWTWTCPGSSKALGAPVGGGTPGGRNNAFLFQMGGDFLVDDMGTVLYSHRCQTPLDRPTVKDILQAADSAEH